MSKYDMYIESKDKVTLSKQDKENYAYAEMKHKANSDIAIFLKLPYYLGYKLPRAIFALATKNTKASKKEAARLKRVIASKERARKSNVLQELEYIESFRQIGFKDSLGNYPVFQSIEKIDKMDRIVFRSNIALSTWERAIEQIETAINTNIIDIRQDKQDKKLVTLDTTKENIPELITWDNKLLLPGLQFNLGLTALKPVIIDMEHYTSGIIGGSVGSGKSVTIQGLIIQLLLKNHRRLCKSRIYLFDGKDMGDYNRFKKYISYTANIDEFRGQLEQIASMYEERKKLFAGVDVEKIAEYNKKQSKYSSKIPEIFVIIDEISIITDKSGLDKNEKAIADRMTRILSDLARLGRAAGIHVIIGIQVPNMQTVPGQLKNVIDMRVSGYLKDESASNIVLNNSLASKLPHIKGRMILDTLEYQSYYFDKNIDYLKDIQAIEKPIAYVASKRKNIVKTDKDNKIIADIDLTE